MNQMFQRVEADLAVSVTELKKNPNAVFAAAEGQAVAVLNHNRVVAYVISPVAWEGMLERLDDLHIIEELEQHKDEPSFEVSLDELSGPIHRPRPEKLEQARGDGPRTVRKVLLRRIQNPHVPAAKLRARGNLYKIKLRGAGYRPAYEVIDDILVIRAGWRGRRDDGYDELLDVGRQSLDDID